MSHHRVKTKYLEMGPYGTTVEKTLYAHHYHGSDIVTFYNEEGNIILTIDDTQENNELDAINRLYQLDMKDDIQNVTIQELEELVKPRFGENPAKQLPEPFRSCFKAHTQPIPALKHEECREFTNSVDNLKPGHCEICRKHRSEHP